MLIVRDVYFSAYDENGEERLYSTTELISEKDYMEKLYAEAAAEEAKKEAGEKLKGVKSVIVDKAKGAKSVIVDKAKGAKSVIVDKAKGADKWAKDLAVKGVDAVKAHPVKTAIGATTAVAVPVASVAGYKYYKKHKKACK